MCTTQLTSVTYLVSGKGPGTLSWSWLCNSSHCIPKQVQGFQLSSLLVTSKYKVNYLSLQQISKIKEKQKYKIFSISAISLVQCICG